MEVTQPTQAFVPGFRNDVFVSYRHAINEGPDRWVERFRDLLVLNLGMYIGRVSVWVDNPPLPSGEEWRRKIRQELDAAAVFLLIYSWTYLDSDECVAELDAFLKRLKEPASPGRLVPVLKHRLRPDAQLPQEVMDIQNHKFYDAEPPPSARFVEFRPDDDKFNQAMSRLAQDLASELLALRGEVPRRSLGTVFLARVKPELHEYREKLRGNLIQAGYAVVPEREYLWHTDAFPEKLASDLHAADVCVHLISAARSDEPEANERARLQLEHATDAMKSRARPLPLIWMQPVPRSAIDPATAPLIDYVERELANEGAEYWTGSFEEFKSQIHDTLASGPASATELPSEEVAVLAEESDFGETARISDFLVDALGVEPRRLGFTGTVPRDPAALAATLGRCNHAIVFWGGHTSEEWVNQVLDLKAVAAHAGAEHLCVYAAAPSTAAKTTYRSRMARVLLESSGVPERDLRQFLTAGGGVP